MEERKLDSYKVLQVGVGIMGMNHANAINDLSSNEDISLCGVCDSSLDKLLAFKESNPDVPVYLVYAPQYQTRAEYEALKERAMTFGLPAIESVSEAVEELDVNSLMNCTNNESHIPVLESALSVRDGEQTKIGMVFQEKPFAHTLQEAEDFTEKIKDENVSFSLNSILGFSGIWDDFHAFIENYPGTLKLKKVITSYGKDRTQDTRPATGGWVGMEAIHAVDISTALIKDLEIEEDKTVSTYGFLARGASTDGQVGFGIGGFIKGQNKQNTGEVEVEIEGSFAWKEQVRRSIYIFEDEDKGTTIASQLLFDKSEGPTKCDELKIFEFDSAMAVPTELQSSHSNVDKLRQYYLCSIDPKERARLYDINRALGVQDVLEKLSRPAKTFNVPASHSAAKPLVPDLSDISMQQLETLKSDGIKGLKAQEDGCLQPQQKNTFKPPVNHL